MKKHLLFLYVLTASFPLFTQQEQHFFRTLDTDDGLPHNFIIDILEDRDGLMWISTPAGLSKYNGQTFTNYVPHVDGSASKENRLPFIWDIFEDSRGQLWLGANNGLFLFDEKTGTAQKHPLFVNDSLGLKNKAVKNIIASPDGELCLALTDRVVCLSEDRKTSRVFVSDQEIEIRNIVVDQQGQIWGCSTSELFFCNSVGKIETSVTFPEAKITNTLAFTLFHDKANRWWLGTSNGLYRFLPGSRQLVAQAISEIKPDIEINKIVEFEDGNLFLATGDNGLIYWNPNDNEIITHLQSNPESSESINSNFVYTLALTNNKNLWLGQNQGISIMPALQHKFSLMAYPGGAKNSNNIIQNLFVENNQKLWFNSSRNNKLMVTNSSWETIDTVRFFPGLTKTTAVHQFQLPHQQDIWVSTRGEGLYKCNNQSYDCKLIKASAFFYDHAVTNILEGTLPNTLWLATEGGLCLFNTQSYDTLWVKPSALNNDQKDNTITRLLKDSLGRLWFFNTDKLCVYTPSTNQLSSFSLPVDESNKKQTFGFITNLVLSNGQLYIGAQNGLIIFDINQQTFVVKKQDRQNDLDGIYSLCLAQDGAVWFARKNQIVEYHPITETFSFHDIKKWCGNFNLGVTAVLPDGRLLFGTKCGLLIIDPAVETIESLPPKVVLSNFLVRNQPYLPGQSPEFLTKIELPYQDNFFTLNYTALEYLEQENITYRYKLIGLNDDWVNAGQDRSVNFANLAPGSYTFLAEATLSAGVHSVSPLRLPILIKPAYWQTVWFKALILACLLAIALAILHARQKAQQLAADKRLAEQNSLYKSKFLANVSHEIRTPLNAILGINSLLMESTNLDQRQQHFTESIHLSCEKLLAIINDLLDQAKIESGKFSLNPQPFELRQLIHQIERLLAHKFSEKGLLLNTKVSEEIPKILIGDAVRLFQILMNLTGNALKFTDEGEVTIQIDASIEKGTHLLRFSVTDTGVGIPTEKLEDIFKSFEQLDNPVSTNYQEQGTGLGLSIARELIELQGGEIAVKSTVGRGTTFHFSLPFQTGEEKVVSAEKNTPTAFPAGLKVLIVDDTPINQFLTAELLKKHLPEVQTDVAANGEVAIDKVSREHYDLILMDVRMPVMGGMEATQQIRNKPTPYFQNIPILGLTSDAIPQQIEACRQAGMNDCLSKPVRTSELTAMIIKYV